MVGSELVDRVYRARCGSLKAVENLYLYLRENLLPRLERTLRQKADAEDILHDTFIILWEHIDRLRDPTKLLAYANQVAVHLVAQGRRKRFGWTPFANLDLPYLDPTPPSMDSQELLQLALGSLSKAQHRLFRLKYAAGATEAQIAEELGITHRNLLVRKHRLLRRLRENLAGN